MIFCPLALEKSEVHGKKIVWGIEWQTKLCAKVICNTDEMVLSGCLYELDARPLGTGYQEYSGENITLIEEIGRVDMIRCMDLLATTPISIIKCGNHGNLVKIKKIHEIKAFEGIVKMRASLYGFGEEHFSVNMKDAKWQRYFLTGDYEKNQADKFKDYLNDQKDKYLLVDFKEGTFGHEIIGGACVVV